MPAIRGSCITNSAELVSISMFSDIVLCNDRCLSLPSLPACAFIVHITDHTLIYETGELEVSDTGKER